jgi:Ca-activated chloride channel homolog
VPIRFDHPSLLWLILLAVPLAWIGYRTLRSMDPVRRATTLALRTILLALIVAMLAGPHAVREHDHVTTIGLIDISGSMQRFAQLPTAPDTYGTQSNIDFLRWWFREATNSRRSGDRIGLVAFDGQAIAVAAPTSGEFVDDNLDMPMMEGTNIAEAIRLGLAMFPGDTGRRLVLISDGNETLGDALDAARQAAGSAGSGVAADSPEGVDRRTGVPIDVLPIHYRITRDVQVARLEAPPHAQPGQTITLRIILEATHEVPGRLILRREGEPIDLSPGEPGHSRHVTLPPGQSVHLAQVTLGDTPVNRFEAVFEPDDPADNLLPENARAEAFTATPSRGRTLIVTLAAATGPGHALARILDVADIPNEVVPPSLLPDDLLGLQNYNLIVLDNIPSYEISQQQQELLARYVDQLGGGLIVSGGDRSFGAGGWTRTVLADILPLELDPPKELRAPASGIVLVLDKSGSMNRPVAGARATQQEVANEAAALAIESLHSETWVGVVTFDHAPELYIPMQPNTNTQEIADRVRAIRPAGGTRIEPALRMAWDMLEGVPEPLQHRHIVLLTDGISQDPTIDQFIEQMADRNVPITTIGVGDDIDADQLQMIADGTGSVFHHVRNPRTLPRVLVDSVQEFNKPLLKEGRFTPIVRATGSTLTIGMDDAPPLGGLVITGPRDDPTAILEMIHPDGEPLLAHWQVGLGRVAAFTSDLAGRWSTAWSGWSGAQQFWTQLARTIARPPVSRDAELITTIRDGRLHVVLEAADEDDGYLDYLSVAGNVYGPDGRTMPIRLRQVGPGRYEGSAPAPHAGVYVVALNPRRGQRQLTPVIGGASRATSEEFRRYVSDHVLLQEITSITGGRMLEVNDPAAIDLFDRAGMPRSASYLPIWPTLLIWSLLVLLLDVGCRRIAWDWPMVKRGVIYAVERVVPARIRAQRVILTLGTLRKVSKTFDEQQAKQAEHVRKLKGTGRVAPPPPRLRPAQREQPGRAKPDESRVSAAIDSMLGTSPSSSKSKGVTDGDIPLSPKSSAAPKQKSPPSAGADSDSPKPSQENEQTRSDGDGSLRSKLLAAKKRARDQMNRDE